MHFLISLFYLTSSLILWGHQVEAFHPKLALTKQRHRDVSNPSLRQHASALYTGATYTKLHSTLTDNDDVCTVQILMSDTGGGHRASANAIRDAFDVLYPGKIQCDIVDIYSDYGPFWPYNAYVPLYKIMAEYSFLWDWFYHFGATQFGLWLNEFMLELFCFEPFKECMARPSGNTNRRADMVVSVHPLCQDIPLKILSYLDSDGKTRGPEGRTTPFVTVVTDLGGAHPTWFNPAVNTCFVPTSALYQLALDRKLRPGQIVQHGLPIRKGFWGNDGAATAIAAATTSGKSVGVKTAASTDESNPLASFVSNLTGRNNNNKGEAKQSTSTIATSNHNNNDKTSLRSKLGLECDAPTVLVVGGGDGMGGIVKIATCLGKQLSSDAQADNCRYQMVVVCGKNEAAKSTLQETTWGKGVNVKIQGFVNNMDEWMRTCDALVTKAGPGTIAEASICGLPCMLSSYIPGQEEGNVLFVENAGFGRYSGDPTVISEAVSSWLKSPTMLSSMRDSALKAARPSATLCIAKDIAQTIFTYKKSKVRSS